MIINIICTSLPEPNIINSTLNSINRYLTSSMDIANYIYDQIHNRIPTDFIEENKHRIIDTTNKVITNTSDKALILTTVFTSVIFSIFFIILFSLFVWEIYYNVA